MRYFKHVVTSLDGPETHVWPLSDLEIIWIGDNPFLYTTTAAGGGITMRALDDQLTVLDQASHARGAMLTAPMRLASFELDGRAQLLVYGQPRDGLGGYTLDPSGQMASAFSLLSGLTAATSALQVIETARGTRFIYTAEMHASGITGWKVTPEGGLEEITRFGQDENWQGSEITAMAHARVGDTDFLLAVSAFDDSLVSYRVGADGDTALVGRIGAVDGLGIAAPNVLAVTEVAGKHYVLVGASGSSSISVAELRDDGSFIVTDHVIDTLETRFQGIGALEVVMLGDRPMVIVGGGDDGLTLMTLLPGGWLLELETIADTDAFALQNVTTLEAEVIGGVLHLFTGAEGEAGVGHFTIDPGPLIRTIAGTPGSDTLGGGDGNDLLWGRAGDDTLEGGAGDDILMDGAGIDELWGGEGADIFVMEADGMRDVIRDFELDRDRLDLSAWGRVYTVDALDFKRTGKGAILWFGEEEIELIRPEKQGMDADDLSYDQLFDLWHIDTGWLAEGRVIEGTPYDDTLKGGAGDDIINGFDGADEMIGNGGVDTVTYEGAVGSLLVDMTYTHVNTNVAKGDTFDGIENISGSQGRDNLRGNEFANRIEGGRNVDYLVGRKGDDTIDGGIGNDVLFGGPGADLLIGGDDQDRAQHTLSLTGLTLDLMFPHLNTGEAAGDVWVSIEDLAGSEHDDFIFGDQGDNRLFGRRGADKIYGRAGNDYLNGSGNADRLDGGPGADTLRGGLHNDTFVFSGGRDLVEDFNAAQGDRIAFSEAVFPFLDGMSNVQIVNTYADVIDDKVVFTLGWHTLTIENLDTLAGLAADVMSF